MSVFIHIVLEIVLPVFVLIAIGALLQRKVQLDLRTLAKLNMHFLIPGIIFVKLYESTFSFKLFGMVFLSMSLIFIVLLSVSWLTSRLTGMPDRIRSVFTSSLLFYNVGNYGIPVNSLVFRQDPFALSVQVMILVIQNLFTFTYGIFLMSSSQSGKWRALLGYVRMPLFYALILAITLNLLQVPIPAFIWIPAGHIADAMVAIALITLGAQVANLPIRWTDSSIWLNVALRLLLGPAIAFAVLTLLGIDGVVAQALLISSAMPTSVNSAIIAQEYNNEPEFAARIVMVSTLFSSATVSLVIYAALRIF